MIMNAEEIAYKSKLIDKINTIQKREVLDEVNGLLEVDIEEKVYQTNADQKKEIELARIQIDFNK